MSSYGTENVPALRGILHLNAAFIIPNVAVVMGIFCTARQWQYLLPATVIMEYTLGMSALLHTVDRHNQWYQKLDHIGVFLSIYASSHTIGYFGPMQYSLLAQLVVGYGVVQKLLQRNSTFTVRDRIIAVTLVLIWIVNIKYIQIDHVKKLYYLVVANLLTCIVMHTVSRPMRDNPIFGYHEIMHLLTILNVIIGCGTILLN